MTTVLPCTVRVYTKSWVFRVALLALGLAGCGRLNFDARGGDGDAMLPDASLTVMPPLEVSPGVRGALPKIVSAGGVWGITYFDIASRNSMLARVDSNSQLLNTVQVNDGTGEAQSSFVVWNGEYTVVWEDYRAGSADVRGAQFSAMGTKVGIDKSVATGGGTDDLTPQAAVTNSGIGVVYNQINGGSPGLKLVLHDPLLAPLGQFQVSLGPAQGFSYINDGTFNAITWSDVQAQYQIAIAVHDSMGVLSDAAMVSTTGGTSPSLAAHDSGYAVAWIDGVERLQMSVLDANLVATTTQIASVAGVPALVWTGSGYGLAWHGGTIETGAPVLFAELDAAGKLVAAPIQVTPAGVSTGFVAIAWNGADFGIAWELLSAGMLERVYFTQVTRQ